MIIGETYNENNYYGHGEENYDYLFKRKTKEERQQKKVERKEKRTEKKVIRQGKREEKKLQKEAGGNGGKRKLPILGNFGLFDKNKKKNNAPGSTGSSSSSESSAKRETADSPESSRSEESKSTPEIKTAAPGTGAASAAADKTESGSASTSESGDGSEGAKTESTAVDKNGNPKKEAGFGPMFGFVMLGITVLVVGVVLYGVNKKSKEALPAMKVAA